MELGDDDIVRIPHSVRRGKDAPPMPVLAVNKRHMSNPDSVLVHVIFNHCSAERIYRTLQVTKGYKAVRMPHCPCKSCSLANARRRGLRHTAFPAQEAPAGDLVHGEGYDPEGSDDEDMSDVMQYQAAVVGRELGVQPRSGGVKALRGYVCR